MKRLICIICILGFAGISNAKQPTQEHIERWQNLSENLTYYNLYVIMDEMQNFSLKPWPEPLRQVLLKMAITFKQMSKDRAAGKPIILPDKFGPRGIDDGKCDGEIDDVLIEAIVQQKDPRFLFFFKDWGLGGWPGDGLAGIGEPAFETIIKGLNRKNSVDAPYQASRALGLILQEENNFLKTDLQKREIAKRALINLAQNHGRPGQFGAISTLRFFPSTDVIKVLETISLTDPYRSGGQFPLRVRAQESLEYLRTH